MLRAVGAGVQLQAGCWWGALGSFRLRRAPAVRQQRTLTNTDECPRRQELKEEEQEERVDYPAPIMPRAACCSSSAPPLLRLLLLGDTMLGRLVNREMKHRPPSHVWGNTLSCLRSRADACILNLETSLTDSEVSVFSFCFFFLLARRLFCSFFALLHSGIRVSCFFVAPRCCSAASLLLLLVRRRVRQLLLLLMILLSAATHQQRVGIDGRLACATLLLPAAARRRPSSVVGLLALAAPCFF